MINHKDMKNTKLVRNEDGTFNVVDVRFEGRLSRVGSNLKGSKAAAVRMNHELGILGSEKEWGKS